MTTPHEQAQHGVAELVRSLNLPDLPAGRVYERLTQHGANITYPCCVVSIAGLIEEKERIAFGMWLWTYPVLVLFAHRGDAKDPAEQPVYMAWRDPIEHALEEAQTLPGVQDFHDIEVQVGGSVSGIARGRTEPGQTADPAGPAWLKVAGGMVARVQVLRSA
jgi:hypothetical protein